MFDKPTSNQAMGLELDSFALRIAALAVNAAKPFVEELVETAHRTSADGRS